MYGQKQKTVTPVQVPRSVRLDDKRVITSGDAGYVIPVAAIPMLREDEMRTSRSDVGFEMGETADQLLNGVHVVLRADFVPKIAETRFKGSLEQYNRSFSGRPTEDNGSEYIPYLNTTVAGPSSPSILKSMGIHTPEGSEYRRDYIAAYNILVSNWRRNVSKSLPTRTENEWPLARAFWSNTQMRDIVPTFDSQQTHGDVPITFETGGQMPIHGIGHHQTPATYDDTGARHAVNGNVQSLSSSNQWSNTDTNGVSVRMDNQNPGFPDVYAELEADGVSLSLANLELARKTQAWAQVRQRYQGVREEYLIDMLMSGIRVPELEQQQPILLAKAETIFGYNQRYASDYANLEKSLTSGATGLSLNVMMPRTNIGGVILITAQITPEQLYERQKDYFLYTKSLDEIPDAMTDILDPEKIEVVENSHVDVAHSDPEGLFGYAPLNHGWMRNGPNIGGKFMRTDPNATWDEDRNRFWSPDTVDPKLTEDFYLCTDIPKTVFADGNVDSFEITLRGTATIVGNTVFGERLMEATDDYEDIMSKVDQTRIVQEEVNPEDEEPVIEGEPVEETDDETPEA